MSRYTPWFSAQDQPPVHGGPFARYQFRCKEFGPHLWQKRWVLNAPCQHCEWRGLTRAAYLKAGGK